MNVTALVGRLTKDPELRYTPSGVATATFTLAVDDPFSKGEKKADFIPIVVWRQAAEACANYLRKGRLCAVEGRIATRNYEKDGRKVYVTEIVANNVRFLEHGNDEGKTVGSNADKQSSHNSNNNGKPIDISDDDLPF